MKSGRFEVDVGEDLELRVEEGHLFGLRIRGMREEAQGCMTALLLLVHRQDDAIPIDGENQAFQAGRDG